MTEAHLEALHRAINGAALPAERALLREVLYELTAIHSTRMSRRAASILLEEPSVGAMDEDLLLAEALITKGIMHNGLSPDMSATQVRQAIEVASLAFDRVRSGRLEQAQEQLLADVFDHAAELSDSPRSEIRRLESQVRAGLGLEQRLVWNPDQLPLS